jgi:hypothetical protein
VACPSSAPSLVSVVITPTLDRRQRRSSRQWPARSVRVSHSCCLDNVVRVSMTHLTFFASRQLPWVIKATVWGLQSTEPRRFESSTVCFHNLCVHQAYVGVFFNYSRQASITLLFDARYLPALNSRLSCPYRYIFNASHYSPST